MYLVGRIKRMPRNRLSLIIKSVDQQADKTRETAENSPECVRPEWVKKWGKNIPS